MWMALNKVDWRAVRKEYLNKSTATKRKLMKLSGKAEEMNDPYTAVMDQESSSQCKLTLLGI
jgi:hypothetical protein